MSRTALLSVICMMLFFNCVRKSNAPVQMKLDIHKLSPDSLYILVETGAGEVPAKIWDIQEQMLVADTAGRPWDFLPAIANHGRLITGQNITSWPVLLLTHRLPPGHIVACKPIAVMSLDKDDRRWYYVIALPSDTTLPAIRPVSYMDFMTRYDGVRHLLENWMIHYQGLGAVQRVQWHAELYLQELIDSTDANFKE